MSENTIDAHLRALKDAGLLARNHEKLRLGDTWRHVWRLDLMPISQALRSTAAPDPKLPHLKWIKWEHSSDLENRLINLIEDIIERLNKEPIVQVNDRKLLEHRKFIACEVLRACPKCIVGDEGADHPLYFRLPPQ